MFSISSIISAPFLGDLLRMLRTHGRSPRFLNIPNPRNIRYRYSDIGYPISTYKDSRPQPIIQQQPVHDEKSPVFSPNPESKPTISRNRFSTLIPRGINRDRKQPDKPIASPSPRNKPG